MAIEHIRNAILAEARAEAQKIEAKARSRHDERLEAARKALKTEYSRRLEQAEHEAEQHSRRQLIQLKAEHNLALLKQRNEILDQLFAQAAERLAELPDKQYCAVMEKWLQKLPGNVGGELLCNERDEKRLAPLVGKLNAARPEEARLRPIRHSAPISGGVLFRAERFEVDLSLEARVRREREALAPEVATIVFLGDMTV